MTVRRRTVHHTLRASALSLSLLTALSCAHAFDIDVRGEYRTGSEQYRSRVKVVNVWQNGFGASLEAGIFNGQGSIDSFRSDYNEIEAWYAVPVSETVTLLPGGVLTWNTNGSIIKPYLRANWMFYPTWRADARVRYDHANYDSVTRRGMPAGQVHSNNDSAWQLDFFLTKFIDKTAIEYNYAWNKKDDSQFVYNNGRNTQYLHNLKATYTLQPNLLPYAEVAYMGNTADLMNDKNEWRLRLGLISRF
ncbi:oligogalacturonate-specific porin KdgM family protein [Amantichitinum ursilacus]|uniref:Putative N-acetylneuraminic acid outer membrane channel protein NanC n=1 Tax=Amantichitinum ursilacus TaxID=857265 RepID=A0A0N0GP20_9NEIS|nr:oligogalacturonate-specific porin KdgM family protein [Amantichitinum ursilacus]KPC53353.1 putative N-acetylneuraminic acid outer membrane channel protein NanC precursor [Amantichitinum ursilacus]